MGLKNHKIRILICAAVCLHLGMVSSEEVKNTDHGTNDSTTSSTSQLPDSTDERFSSLGELLASLQGINLNTNLQSQINQIEDIEIMTTIKKKVQFDASVLQNQQLNVLGQGIIPQQQFQNQLPSNGHPQVSNNTNRIQQYPNQGGLGTEQSNTNILNQNLQNFNQGRQPALDQGNQNINNMQPFITGNVNNGQGAFINNKVIPNNKNPGGHTNKVNPVNPGEHPKNMLPSKPSSKPNDNYYKDTIFFIDDD